MRNLHLHSFSDKPGVKYAQQKNDMKKMAEILNNSGYKTEAVNWGLENY